MFLMFVEIRNRKIVVSLSYTKRREVGFCFMH